MSFQYFSGQVRGLRGPGLSAAQQADIDAALESVGEESAVRAAGDAALEERQDRAPMDRGPSLGFVPGQGGRAATVSIDTSGFLQSAVDQSGEQLHAGESGLLVGQISFLRGPSLGFSPASDQPIIEGRVKEGLLDGVTDLRGKAVSFEAAVPMAEPEQRAADPRTFDARGNSVSVEAGEIPLPSRRVTWAAGTVTSPATTTTAITNEAIAAGVNVVTYLTYENIAAVSAVRRASDDVARTEGTHYRIDRSRGFVTNLTADALEIDYSGSAQRKDIVSIDPRQAAPVPTITLGTEKARNGQLYAPQIPASHIEIARITRKGLSTFYIPRWKWRNGVHVDRQAEYAAALDHNRRLLAPIRQRLRSGQRVRVISHGNSRASIGTGGNLGLLNTNPNSKANGGDPNVTSWIRDVPGYFELYSQADRALFDYDDPNREIFNTDVGYNLAGGTADGFGAVHVRAGYIWELLKALHAAYPDAVIDYRNWSIGGTNSSNTLNGNGTGNALYPDRWNAVKADIIAGETLYIPIDNMNEGPALDSYSNWVTLANGARDLGAVVHFMGGARADPRFAVPSLNLSAFQMGEMARAAWDTGSAFSDSWRMLAPENLCGLGLCEDELMDASLANHEGVSLQRAIGRDAAQSYL